MMKLIHIEKDETRVGRLLAWTSLYLAIGAGVLLAIMMYVIFADVILRYFFGAPIAGSVEIVYCLMGVLICMGMGLTTYEDGHVRVDLLTSVMSQRLRTLCNVLAHAFSVLAATLVTWRLSIYAIEQTHDLNRTQVLALPVWLVGTVMAVCSVMLVLNLLLHLGRAILPLFNPPAAG